MTEEQDKQFIEVLLDRVKELTKDNYYLQSSNDSKKRNLTAMENRLHSLQDDYRGMRNRLHSLEDDYRRMRKRNLWHRIWNTIP